MIGGALAIITALSLTVSAESVFKSTEQYSSHLEHSVITLSDVFHIEQAEKSFLPFMKDHSDLFKGKTVMDIGTGSGILALYAAKLGARKVVATDISLNAIKSTRINSERLGFTGVIEARLVPPEDMTAYSVVKEGETFDVILCNAPYSIDIDSKINSISVDNGDLGFSIIRGIEKNLAPNGVVVLRYGSFFYHEVLVKFAKFMGHDVESKRPQWMAPWQVKFLFNSYLDRIKKSENIPEDAFSFSRPELRGKWAFIPRGEENRIDDISSSTKDHGIILIRLSSPTTAKR